MLQIILIAAMCYFSIQAVLFLSAIMTEHKTLTQSVIRLHVVADSDGEEAQRLKLGVRDQVTDLLWPEMEGLRTRREAEKYLKGHLDEIRAAARNVLDQEGCCDPVTVSLGKERFHRRIYDTFSLPAGKYESLRITIGTGRGHNWWCVVFPTLCLSASQREFEEKVQAAGLDARTVAALEEGDNFNLRFGFLDLVGEIKNLF